MVNPALQINITYICVFDALGEVGADRQWYIGGPQLCLQLSNSIHLR